jgi:hypothetical protein
MWSVNPPSKKLLGMQAFDTTLRKHTSQLIKVTLSTYFFFTMWCVHAGLEQNPAHSVALLEDGWPPCNITITTNETVIKWLRWAR